MKIESLEGLKAEKLKILTVPSTILKSKAEEITVFDEELETLARNMLYTMYLSPGIGLAGNQVGALKRIFVIDVDYERQESLTIEDEYEYSAFNPKVFINPKITFVDDAKVSTQEGCLSVPEIFENVERHEKILVEYQNLKGETETLDADDLLSVCIQHENDHLNGIVFLDHLSQLKKQFYLKKMKKRKKVYG